MEAGMYRPAGRRVMAAIVGVIAVMLALSPGPAHAGHIACGDVLTQDATLDTDLVNCPDDGVVIGASGITVDLGGHTIDGVLGSGGRGVDDSGGHDRVTVENGTVRDFQVGVNLKGADRSLVSRLAFTVDGTGVYLEDADENVIQRNAFSGTGITVFVSSHDNVIAANSIVGAATGIQLWGSELGTPTEVNGTLVERNRLVANTVGLVVYLGTNATTVRANQVTGSVDFGIAVAGYGTLLERNTVSGNGQGVHVSGQHTTILRNHVIRNEGDGVLAGAGSNAAGTVLDGNTASQNGDDGIDVDHAQTFITRNTANDNGDYGIEAVPGVTDGGGNRARGNGNPAQCLNVTCR